MSACLLIIFVPDCLYWLDFLISEVPVKWLIWSVIGLQNYTFLKWRIFLKIDIGFWINICTFWTSCHRISYWFWWGSVSWLWIEWNVLDHRSSVGHFCIRIGYWLHRSCEICLFCYSCFYFWCFRKFIWQFWYLSNSVIKGRGPSSPHSCSSLTYPWLAKCHYLLRV